MTGPGVDANLLRQLLAVLPENVMLIGEDRTIRFISRLEAGYEGMDVIGMHILDFVAPDSRAEHSALLDRVFESGEPADHVTELVGGDGQQEWYEAKLIPLVAEGRTTWVAIASRNVTARVGAERELAMLRRLLPVCSWCKKVRTEDGEWQRLEAYLEQSEGSTITHGICPECEARLTAEGAEGAEAGGERG